MKIAKKTLRLFAAAATLFLSGLLQSKMQVDLTTDVKGVVSAANGEVPTRVAERSQLVSNGASPSGVYQTKLAVDLRDASTAAGSTGVACNGTTDDTAALQAYLNYYGKGGRERSAMCNCSFLSATAKSPISWFMKATTRSAYGS
jgi:hypothetical protein